MKQPNIKDPTHFARILTYGQVNKCIDKLNSRGDLDYKYIKPKQDLFEFKDAYGEVVLSGMYRNGGYVCRLDRGVFEK